MQLEEEIERLHEAAFIWALACTGYDHGEAEDVLQTAYLKIVDGRARWDGRASVKTWLFSVIRNTAATRRRSAWLRRALLSRWPPPREEPPGPQQRVEHDQQRARIVSALRALPRRQREVVELVFAQELTVDQAAAVMGVAPGTARMHYDRAKRRLLAELGER